MPAVPQREPDVAQVVPDRARDAKQHGIRCHYFQSTSSTVASTDSKSLKMISFGFSGRRSSIVVVGPVTGRRTRDIRLSPKSIVTTGYDLNSGGTSLWSIFNLSRNFPSAVGEID